MRLMLALALLGLAACRQPATDPADTPAEAAPPPAASAEPLPEHLPDDTAAFTFPHGPYRYACADGRSFEARFPARDSAIVTLDRGDSFALASTRAASGARYSDGATEAWFRAVDEAFIQQDGEMTYADCRRTD